MKEEWVVCTFWRSANGQETMHVYGPFGPDEKGQSLALQARSIIRTDFRNQHPTGPLPVIKAVLMKGTF